MKFKFLFKLFYKISLLLISQFFSYKKLKLPKSKVSSFIIFPNPKLIYQLKFQNGISCRGVSFENIYYDPMGKALSVFCDGINKETKIKFKQLLLDSSLLEINKKSGYYFKSIGIEIKNNYPLWSQVWPWEEISHDYKTRIYPNAYSLNRNLQLQKSLFGELDINIKKFPYTDLATELHLIQFLDLYMKFTTFKLSKNTFKHDTLPNFILLVDGDNWKWMAGSEGNHRMYILNFLQYPFLTATLHKIIRKNEVDLWPNVRNGFYSRDDALNIFSALFKGKYNLAGLI